MRPGRATPWSWLRRNAFNDSRQKRVCLQGLLHHRLSQSFAELVTLQKAETSYIDKIDNLEQKLWELQGDIASGSHVPPGTRVLQLKENPASQWEELRRDVLRGLKKENEALLKRLASLDKGRSGSSKEQQAVAGSSAVGQGSDADLVPRESLDRIERERDALEKVVQRGEKRLTRLQQVWNRPAHSSPPVSKYFI